MEGRKLGSCVCVYVCVCASVCCGAVWSAIAGAIEKLAVVMAVCVCVRIMCYVCVCVCMCLSCGTTPISNQDDSLFSPIPCLLPISFPSPSYLRLSPKPCMGSRRSMSRLRTSSTRRRIRWRGARGSVKRRLIWSSRTTRTTRTSRRCTSVLIHPVY